MPLFALPDSRDLADIIIDRLDTLFGHSLTEEMRAQVVGNCVNPMALVIQAGELICAAGELEQITFADFISTLAGQANAYYWRNKRNDH